MVKSVTTSVMHYGTDAVTNVSIQPVCYDSCSAIRNKCSNKSINSAVFLNLVRQKYGIAEQMS